MVPGGRSRACRCQDNTLSQAEIFPVTEYRTGYFLESRLKSMLDNEKFGPGNRPYWEMKEGRVSSRYPDLLRTLSKARDPGQRRLLFESHRRKMGGIIGIPARQLEPRGIGLSRQ